MAGHHDGDLGVLEAGVGQVLQRTDRHRERAVAAHRVVDLGGRTVQRDLHVDVVTGRQPGRHLRGDAHPVGGELHPDMMGGGVVDEFPEVRPHSRFTAADVDVEHLHALELVDDVLALLRGQLARIALARRGQAVHTRQVAGVGQLPGQTDRRVEPVLELLDQPWHRLGIGAGAESRHGHVVSRYEHLRLGQHAQRVQIRTPAARRRFRPRGRRIWRRGDRRAS